MRTIAIGVEQLIGRTTDTVSANANVLSASIIKALDKFGLEVGGIVCAVRDGGQPYPCVFGKNHLNVPSKHCALHRLNLCFEYASNSKTVHDLFAPLLRLSAWLHTVPKANASLRVIQRQWRYDDVQDQLVRINNQEMTCNAPTPSSSSNVQPVNSTTCADTAEASTKDSSTITSRPSRKSAAIFDSFIEAVRISVDEDEELRDDVNIARPKAQKKNANRKKVNEQVERGDQPLTRPDELIIDNATSSSTVIFNEAIPPDFVDPPVGDETDEADVRRRFNKLVTKWKSQRKNNNHTYTLITEAATRWNHTNRVLERLCLLKPWFPLLPTAVAENCDANMVRELNQLIPVNWATIEQFTVLLTSIQNRFVYLESENHVTGFRVFHCCC